MLQKWYGTLTFGVTEDELPETQEHIPAEELYHLHCKPFTVTSPTLSTNMLTVTYNAQGLPFTATSGMVALPRRMSAYVG